MTVVDLLITIVVVTILVTIVLAVITFVAYKLRLTRQPAEQAVSEGDAGFFVPYLPPEQKEERIAHASEA